MKSLVLWLLLSLVAFAGCANWSANNDPSSSALNLNQARMSPGSVGIEIAVAQLNFHQADQLDQLLGVIDQQKLPLEVRRQLDRNGLVCGIMSARPPAVFH